MRVIKFMLDTSLKWELMKNKKSTFLLSLKFARVYSPPVARYQGTTGPQLISGVQAALQKDNVCMEEKFRAIPRNTFFSSVHFTNVCIVTKYCEHCREILISDVQKLYVSELVGIILSIDKGFRSDDCALSSSLCNKV